MQTERNELSRSFLSICRVLKQKAVDNQRLEAEIVKLRSALGLSSVRCNSICNLHASTLSSSTSFRPHAVCSRAGAARTGASGWQAHRLLVDRPYRCPSPIMHLQEPMAQSRCRLCQSRPLLTHTSSPWSTAQS